MIYTPERWLETMVFGEPILKSMPHSPFPFYFV